MYLPMVQLLFWRSKMLLGGSGSDGQRVTFDHLKAVVQRPAEQAQIEAELRVILAAWHDACPNSQLVAESFEDLAMVEQRAQQAHTLFHAMESIYRAHVPSSAQAPAGAQADSEGWEQVEKQ